MEEGGADFYPLDSSRERVVMQRRVGPKRFIHFNCPPHQTHLCQALKEREVPHAVDPREHAIVLEGVKAIGSDTLELKPGLLLKLLGGRNGWQIGLA